MKNYLSKELAIRIEDFRHNNPHQMPREILLHPVAYELINKAIVKKCGLVVRTSEAIEPLGIIIY